MSKRYTYSVHSQTTKKCEQNDPVLTFSSIIIRTLLFTGRYPQLFSDWEERGIKLLFICSSCGHLCRVFSAGVTKRFVQSPSRRPAGGPLRNLSALRIASGLCTKNYSFALSFGSTQFSKDNHTQFSKDNHTQFSKDNHTQFSKDIIIHSSVKI
jgi:hypothetical protein